MESGPIHPTVIAKSIKSGRVPGRRIKAKPDRRKLRNLLPLLQSLKSVKPDARKVILNRLDDKSLEEINETIHNVLVNTRVPVKQAKRLSKVLQPHKNTLRYLARPSASPRFKRKKIQEMGGFPFTALLSAAIPLLVSYLFPSKKKK